MFCVAADVGDGAGDSLDGRTAEGEVADGVGPVSGALPCGAPGKDHGSHGGARREYHRCEPAAFALINGWLRCHD